MYPHVPLNLADDSVAGASTFEFYHEQFSHVLADR
jgi:hypothetical protein